MSSIHEAKFQQAMQLMSEIAAFVRDNDNSYERELRQLYRIEEHGANLVRYAEAVRDGLDSKKIDSKL